MNIDSKLRLIRNQRIESAKQQSDQVQLEPTVNVQRNQGQNTVEKNNRNEISDFRVLLIPKVFMHKGNHHKHLAKSY